MQQRQVFIKLKSRLIEILWTEKTGLEHFTQYFLYIEAINEEIPANNASAIDGLNPSVRIFLALSLLTKPAL
jgi:hypothetical protein